MAEKSPKMKRRQHRLRALALLVVGGGLVLVGMLALLFLPRLDAQASIEAGDVIPAALKSPAPELALVDLQGNPVTLKGLRGQVVLINNWAIWCPPCRAEMPTLEAYYQDHKAEGFVLLGVNAGDAQQDVARFVAEYELTFPIWLDPANDSLRSFYTTSLPSSFVIDQEGTTVLGWRGEISRARLEEYVTPLFEE